MVWRGGRWWCFPDAGLELDAEEDGAEVEGGFPVSGAVGAVAEGAAVEDGVHVLLGHFAELVVFRRL